jgi:D-alanyl-D-alanine carboxypeptidase
VSIAENVAGSVEGFAALMNNAALSAGAVNSHFTNPHGLHDDDHYTTPLDMALISRQAMGNYTFSSIIGKTGYTLPATNKHESFPALQNTHPILGENEGMDFTVTGGKTGYTSKAKCTLVTYASDYLGRSVICVVANIPDRDLSGALSLQLIKKAFDDFAVQHVSQPGQLITGFLSEDFEFPVASAKGIEYLLPRNRNSWMLETDLVSYGVAHPSKGDIVGTLSYTYKGVPIGSTYLVCASDGFGEVFKGQVYSLVPENCASMPLRFLIPLSAALLLTLLFLFVLGYNKRQMEE